MSPLADSPLAVSLGDPAGVGPEVIAAAWLRRETEGLRPFFVAGGRDVLADVGRTLAAGFNVITIEDPTEAAAAFVHGLPVLGASGGPWKPGEPDTDGAWLAYDSLKWAAAITRGGQAAAMVTGPVAKARLADIGFEYPGQTEFVAAACGVNLDDAVMMLAGPSLRTVPLTIHVALAEVPGLINSAMIVRKARIVADALTRDFGIAEPRVAIAALNPHAGEEGRMGHEDIAVVAPAIDELNAMGIAATGPHPADALFTPRARATYDVAICMYHDQALIPIKALDFDEGVNVTLGLPIVRTSPDHGTAYTIAGKGIADPGAMIAAIRMAGEMAQRRAGNS
ncbi:MAG: 4-hydroxythreonine-4-phosphate dehydrogenase PdxA [Novosphingobium sp.]